MTTEPFGPIYPDLGTGVAKLRRAKKYDRKAHGEAVLGAIRSKQASCLRGAGVSLPAPRCASGSAHTTGAAILRSVAVKQRAALAALVTKERRERTRFEWLALYQRAMVECGKAKP